MRYHFIRSAFALTPFLAAGCRPDFGVDVRHEALSYEKYVTDVGLDGFDPVGGSGIDYRLSSTRDGFDRWWRLRISPEDYRLLLAASAAAHRGPSDPRESDQVAYPSAWRPEGPPPDWWDRQVGKNARSIAWSVAAGAAERHEGWYFLYDPEAERLWCWHWNHQWSSDQVGSRPPA